MNKDNIIATVKLAPGDLGFFDNVSGIRLTQNNSIAQIPAGTNCSVLRASVKSGRLLLMSGNLGEPKSIKEIFNFKKDTFSIDPVVNASKTTVAKKGAAKKTKPVVEVEDIAEVKEEIKEVKDSPKEEVISDTVIEEKIEKVETEPEKEEVIVESTIEVNATEVTLSKKGETFKITTNQEKASYESEDTSVATVNKKGNIVAKGEGETTVIVKADGCDIAKINVVVKFED